MPRDLAVSSLPTRTRWPRSAHDTVSGDAPAGASRRGVRHARAHAPAAPHLGEHLQVLRKLAPLDERVGLALRLRLAREVGLADLLELLRGHRQLGPLRAERVAQRAAERGEVKEPVLRPIEPPHQVAHVEPARADDDGHAVPDRLALAHADGRHDPEVARQSRFDAHRGEGSGCEAKTLALAACVARVGSRFMRRWFHLSHNTSTAAAVLGTRHRPSKPPTGGAEGPRRRPTP